MKLITLIAALSFAVAANAQQSTSSTTTSTAAPTKAEVEQEDHKWMSYELGLDNGNFTNRSGSSIDGSLYGELYLNLPGAITTGAGDITTSIGIWPELTNVDNTLGKSTDAIINDYVVVTNSLALPENNTSPFVSVNTIVMADVRDIDGTGTDSAFYLYGITKKLELSNGTTIASAPGVKVYADSNTDARWFASTNWTTTITEKLTLDIVRNETRYEGGKATRMRFGSRVGYKINGAMKATAYLYGDPNRDENNFGGYAYISGSL